jgi:hypothetical protein
MPNLDRFINGCECDTSVTSRFKLLPLIHTTNSQSFWRMTDIATYGIKKQKCKLYKIELVYFFYGIPAYVEKKAQRVPIDKELPVSILLKSESEMISHAKSLFPFDTGYFFNERKYTKTQLELFRVNSINIEKLNKFVYLFFENIYNYLIANVSYKIEEHNFIAKDYLNEIKRNHDEFKNNEVSKNYDRRIMTIELQYDMDIPFRELDKICLPSLMLSSPKTREQISKNLRIDKEKDILEYKVSNDNPTTAQYYIEMQNRIKQYTNY